PAVATDADHKAAEQKAEQERQELAKLRADAAAREKVEQEAALRRQVEEDTRKKLEAEAAAKRQAEDDARQAAAAADAGPRRPPARRQPRWVRRQASMGRGAAPITARLRASAGISRCMFK